MFIRKKELETIKSDIENLRSTIQDLKLDILKIKDDQNIKIGSKKELRSPLQFYPLEEVDVPIHASLKEICELIIKKLGYKINKVEKEEYFEIVEDKEKEVPDRQQEASTDTIDPFLGDDASF